MLQAGFENNGMKRNVIKIIQSLSLLSVMIRQTTYGEIAIEKDV
jgi:hypothetical protein